MRKRRKFALIAAVAGGVAAVVIGAIGLSRPSPQSYTTMEPPTRKTFDDADYAVVLETCVNDEGLVDYAGLKESPDRLDAFVRQVATLSPEAFGRWEDERKIAFWINAYNALTLKVIVENYPIKPRLVASLRYPNSSIRQIPGVWTEVRFTVTGRDMTLDRIEHEVLRKDFDEPRIHVALVCAAMSCPELRREPYRGPELSAQLADQGRTFFADEGNFRIDRDDGVVHLSSIFKWFGEDFVSRYEPETGFGDREDAERAVLHYAAGSLSPSDAEFLREGRYDIAYIEYDWSLNEWDRSEATPRAKE